MKKPTDRAYIVIGMENQTIGRVSISADSFREAKADDEESALFEVDAESVWAECLENQLQNMLSSGEFKESDIARVDRA